MNGTSFSNLVVLDLSRYLPGGYATQVFADLGAKVIKVEDTGEGDFCRHEPPMKNNVSFYYSALCRNKKSVSFNLKHPAALRAFMKLASEADVVIESFRPGVTKRLGIDYGAVKTVNPGIVYCSISAFGQNDPRSLKALHDINMMAACGYLSLNGCAIPPLPLCDMAASMVAVQDVLAALCQRAATGEGAYCDVSMFDSFVWWNSLLDARYDFNGDRLELQDLEHPSVGYNLYETKDGRTLSCAIMESKFWIPFCKEMGFGEDMYEAMRLHRESAPEAFEKMEKLFASRTLAEWKKLLGDKDVCIAPVETKCEAIAHIVASGTGMMEYSEFPQTGRTLLTNIPHNISSLPRDLKGAKPPHKLGEDNLEILLGLGYSRENIDQMAAEGAINAVIE
jgi:crotonobetainyl-CoA:carnitine CoA-transferase CaiB-like acyl-CoA transferase